jgi:hypothetical protein
MPWSPILIFKISILGGPIMIDLVCNCSNTTGATSGAGTATFPEHQISLPIFSGVRVAWSLVFCVGFFRSLFVLLFFFFWPLSCLSFDLRILIIPLVSSNPSWEPLVKNKTWLFQCNYLAFQSFQFERTLLMVFQQRRVYYIIYLRVYYLCKYIIIEIRSKNTPHTLWHNKTLHRKLYAMHPLEVAVGGDVLTLE